jgi:hypothetical protein
MLDFAAHAAGTFSPSVSSVAVGNRWKSDGTKWRSARGWTLIEKRPAIATTPYVMVYLPPGWHHIEIRVRALAQVTHDNGQSIVGYLSYDAGNTWGAPGDYGQTQLYAYSQGVTGGGSVIGGAYMGTSGLQPGWPSIYLIRIYPGDADTYGCFQWTTMSYYTPSAPPGVLHAEGGSYSYESGAKMRADYFLFQQGNGAPLRHNGLIVTGMNRA